MLNFVLNRNGYPTLYLNLGHREKYLDAVEEGNKEHYKPIIDFLSEIYLEQHRTIYDEIIGKIRSGKSDVFTDNKRVVQEFSKMPRKNEVTR